MSADPKAPEPGRERLARLTMEFLDGFVPGPLRKHAVPALDDLVRAYQKEAVDGAEAPNAELPATPEPATPMPRIRLPCVSDQWADTYANSGSQPGPVVRDLALDLIDSRSREAEGRAKVAELEARIPAARESLLRFLTTGNAAREAFLIEPAAKGYDALHGRYRARLWPMGDQTNEEWRAFLDGLTASWNFALGGAALLDKAVAREDEMRAALARANEALRCVFATYPHEQHFWQTYPAALDAIRIAAGAQGSAAQKPEGPQ